MTPLPPPIQHLFKNQFLCPNLYYINFEGNYGEGKTEGENNITDFTLY
jgi:hypothetical protein